MQTSNLTQRILTAMVLGPLAVLGILFLSNRHFALALGVVVLLGAWEWGALAGQSHRGGRVAYVLATGLALYALSRWNESFPPGWLLLSTVALAWWGVALVRVIRFERAAGTEPREGTVAGILMGWLILLPFWGALVAIHRHPETGSLLVIVLMTLIWGADSGAYFAGRRFGRHRLAPRTSPGKSWEGVAGGLVAALLLSGAIGLFAGLSLRQVLAFIALSLVTVLLSVLGDVTESLFKRRAGVKDSGNLLPGHGGILDRIDSLTTAAPFFALALYLAGW
uniref:Phosphatidate cytidylyltransferase n=1 Tax=Candidatus Kentrum sp. DK TaxID=2126562 RepID=A0A450SVA6_9GAMM|nr:MAG: phosphatidate cytidylyltransferase [Candidatus Kentron sp. DK]VFJ57941.1 MAG: phosphatidate cytidylyltransferase [Candidatus Kentron sp. DK]